MKTIRFYFDPVSPFAWLAFQRLPEALMGLSHEVIYKPAFLGPMLRHHGLMGPGEVAAKREWTYRHVLWLGRELGIPLAMPVVHPFNPLPLARLALATSTAQNEPGAVNRYVAEQVLRHVWEGGADALAPERLQALEAHLADHMQQRGRELTDPNGAGTKELLRNNTQEAIAAGAFGVPAMVVDGKLFWGLDSLPMLRAYLQGDDWFNGPEWAQAGARPSALTQA